MAFVFSGIAVGTQGLQTQREQKKNTRLQTRFMNDKDYAWPYWQPAMLFANVPGSKLLE
jgi:hypothetical protein